jgi:hypothetical protein
MSDDLTKLINGDPATFSSGYAGKGEESVYDRTGFPPVEIAPSSPMSDDLIKRDDALAKLATAIAALRDMVAVAEQDGWDKAITGRQMILRDARAVLAELETEPLGAEFEAVWDANKGELYEP